MCLDVVIGWELQVVKLYFSGNVYILGSALAFHHSDHVMQTVA